jgi:hypothetical protein
MVGMKYGKLRIAFSAMCGLLCLLLFALWWRSYWWEDYAYNPITSQRALVIYSYKGQSQFRLGYSQNGFARVPGQLPFWMHSANHLGWTSISEPASGRKPRYSGFDIDLIQQTGPFITAPHWFVMLTMIAVGAAPWIKWSKRFSLRTLFIAATIIAVILGLASMA